MKNIKILLMWHTVSSPNYGVSALALSQLSSLNRIANQYNRKIEITLLGTAGDDSKTNTIFKEFDRLVLVDECLFTLKNIVSVRSKKRKSIYSLVKSCDFAIDISEGDSFASIYGRRRYWVHAISKLIVLFLGRELILAPQTLGPFSGRKLEKIVNSFIFKKSKVIFVRDEKSLNIVKEFGISTNTILTADIAFSLPSKKDVTSNCYDVAINVSGLLYNRGYDNNTDFDMSFRYSEFIETLIEYFINKSKRVALVPHVYSPHLVQEDDLRVCNYLAKKYDGIDVLVGKDPMEVKAKIKNSSLFIGSRMHACIGAVSVGVPTIFLAYSRKFQGVFDVIDYHYGFNLYDYNDISELIYAIEALQKKIIGSGITNFNNSRKMNDDYIQKLGCFINEK